MTPSVTASQLFTALRAWLLTVVPAGTPVVQAFDNDVPSPRVQDPANPGGTLPLNYVILRTTGRERLATEQSTYQDGGHNGTDTFRTLAVSTQWTAQVDFYGPGAEDLAQVAADLFRSEPACAFFGSALAGLAPLYEEDPVQIPLVDGEHQWERRMVLGLHFNYTPSVQVPQDFAATLTPTVIDLT